MHHLHSAILGAGSITDTPLWTPISNVARALGVLFVIFGIINTVRQLAAGKTTGAIKVAVITVIGAAFLFDLSIIESILDMGKSIVELVVNSFSDLITGGGSGGSGGTPPPTVGS